MKIASFLWIILSGLLLWAGYTAYEEGYVRFNYPSTAKYPVHGVDISHHQGEIDWQQFAKENIKFAYIKATEGGDHKDRLFQQNWKDAQAIGLTTGAYHFFTFCRTGSEQAENFISTVPKAALQLPPAIDLEFGGNCKATPQKSVLLAQLKSFIEQVKETYGRQPVIYATNDSYEHFLANTDLKTPIWIRDIYNEPELSDGRPWAFWQYAHQARLKGVKGIIDLNVYNGNLVEFNDYVLKHSLTSTVSGK